MSRYRVSRRIEIDAAHRIPDHRSQCRHLHGHRYVIEAVCEATELHQSGGERGMVVDFGFLSDLMRREIDAYCDHGLIVTIDDHELLACLAPASDGNDDWRRRLNEAVARDGYAVDEANALAGRLYVIAEPPTAEVLAAHWFHRLAPRVAEISDGSAAVVEVIVWETPNCWASYRPSSER
jgi:6-pyruvoyltetrahydropterin/6-carboxytetrahydropterin synthase